MIDKRTISAEHRRAAIELARPIIAQSDDRDALFGALQIAGSTCDPELMRGTTELAEGRGVLAGQQPQRQFTLKHQAELALNRCKGR